MAKGLFTDFFDEICVQPKGHDLKLKEAEIAIVDATLIVKCCAFQQSLGRHCSRSGRRENRV